MDIWRDVSSPIINDICSYYWDAYNHIFPIALAVGIILYYISSPDGIGILHLRSTETVTENKRTPNLRSVVEFSLTLVPLLVLGDLVSTTFTYLYTAEATP